MQNIKTKLALYKGFVRLILPSLLPLLLYFLVSEIFDENAGMLLGLLMGFAEFIIVRIREHRNDWFIVLDTVLLIILSFLSWGEGNTAFFRFKPALMEFLIALIFGILLLGPDKILRAYIFKGSLAPLGENFTQPAMRSLMRKNLAFMTLIIFLHALLTSLAAFLFSKELWAFISGPGLLIAFALMILGQFFIRYFFKARRKKNYQIPRATQESIVAEKS